LASEISLPLSFQQLFGAPAAEISLLPSFQQLFGAPAAEIFCSHSFQQLFGAPAAEISLRLTSFVTSSLGLFTGPPVSSS